MKRDIGMDSGGNPLRGFSNMRILGAKIAAAIFGAG